MCRECFICDLRFVTMETVTFECSGSNNQSSEFALNRPYPCCGWDVPPASFSGKYQCITNPINAQYGCNSGWINFTLPIVDYCTEGFTYQDPNYPNEGSIPIRIGLNLTTCLEPSESVPPGQSGFSVSFLDFLNINGTFTCDSSKFSFSGSSSSDDESGTIYTVTVEINP